MFQVVFQRTDVIVNRVYCLNKQRTSSRAKEGNERALNQWNIIEFDLAHRADCELIKKGRADIGLQFERSF